MRYEQSKIREDRDGNEPQIYLIYEAIECKIKNVNGWDMTEMEYS